MSHADHHARPNICGRHRGSFQSRRPLDGPRPEHARRSFLLFDSIAKLLEVEPVVAESAKLGYPAA
jgi:hypothetical protein